MYTIILILFISLTFFFYIIRKKGSNPLIVAVIVIFSAESVYLTISALAHSFLAKEEEVILEAPLVNMGDKDNREGSFFLVGGSIENVSYYQYYIKQDGGYKREKVNADKEDITIFETKDVEPSLRITRKVISTQYANWILDHHWWSRKYKFYVPEGTVKKEFKIK